MQQSSHPPKIPSSLRVRRYFGLVQHRISDVDPEAKQGICSECGPTRIHPQARGKYWICREVKKKHGRRSHVYAKYGLSWRDHDAIATSQEYKCAICGIPDIGNVDHDHSTGKVRGLLCRGCNLGLGNFRDDVQIMQAAIEYLGRC